MSAITPLAKRIFSLCETKATNLSALCTQAEVKYTTLHAQIHNARPIPFETIQKLARAANVSVEWFANSKSDPYGSFDTVSNISGALVDQVLHASKLQGLKQGKTLDMHTLALIYYQCGGLYSALEPFKEQFDAYYVPEPGDQGVRLFHMGKESLTTRTLQEHNPDKLQATLNAAPANLKATFLHDYRRATHGEFVFGIEHLNAMAEKHGQMVRMDYMRLLIRFDCEDNGPLIINLSELLR
ncbi:MAG: hypothetical protein ACRBBQ_10590 [Cognatishimia sp.]